MRSVDGPLAGTIVLDLSQFLAGPVAAMRLADLGARVIKVERPVTGDIGRTLSFAGRVADGETLSFHAMNRNKEGIVADLKDPQDRSFILELVAQADVLIQNFRPGVMERLGLDYDTLRGVNPRLIYASVSGYGEEGPWRDRPGQDLLAQAISGLPWLSGSAEDPPVPVGLALADHLASCHLAQGVVALLYRRERTGHGGQVQTSLLEGMLDLQFELLSSRLNDPSLRVERDGPNSAHAFLGAPYGTYQTSDGYLALAMNPIDRLGELLGIDELRTMKEPTSWWSARESIRSMLAARLRTNATAHWLEILDGADIWCAPVLSLEELLEADGFAALRMVQEVVRDARLTQDSRPLALKSTRSPIRIDGHVLTSERAAPKLGQDTAAVRAEFGIDATIGLEGA